MKVARNFTEYEHTALVYYNRIVNNSINVNCDMLFLCQYQK